MIILSIVFLIYWLNIVFKKSIYGFYLATLLQNALKVITPFYIIYFVALGFSFWQIALISSLRSIVGLIFEIPTGMIADIYGKKTSVILGYSLSALTLFLIPLTDNFLWIAVVFCFNAFFETFFTGADNAWVSDRIEAENPDDMKSFFMRKMSLRNIGFIVAGLLWAWIVKYRGIEYLRYVYGGGLLLASGVLLFLPDGMKGYCWEEENILSKIFWHHLRDSRKYLAQHKTLWFLFAGIGLFLILDELTGLIWAPYLEELGFSIENLGYLSSLLWLLWAGVPLLLEKVLKKKKNSPLVLGGSLVLFVGILIFAGLSSSITVLICLYIIYNFIDDIILPIDELLTNQLISAEKRATVLSMKSVVENLSSILGWPLVWWILWYLTFSQGLFLSAGLLLVIAGVYVFFSCYYNFSIKHRS